MKNYNFQKGPQEEFMKKPIDNKTKARIDSGICETEARIINLLSITTRRSSSIYPNLSNSPKRIEDYQMSDNEIHARDYLADCSAHNISAAHMRNNIVLTDEECYLMCMNYIYSYRDIRTIFKVPMYFVHKTIKTRMTASGPNIQKIPIKLSDKIIKSR